MYDYLLIYALKGRHLVLAVSVNFVSRLKLCHSCNIFHVFVANIHYNEKVCQHSRPMLKAPRSRSHLEVKGQNLIHVRFISWLFVYNASKEFDLNLSTKIIITIKRCVTLKTKVCSYIGDKRFKVKLKSMSVSQFLSINNF